MQILEELGQAILVLLSGRASHGPVKSHPGHSLCRHFCSLWGEMGWCCSPHISCKLSCPWWLCWTAVAWLGSGSPPASGMRMVPCCASTSNKCCSYQMNSLLKNLISLREPGRYSPGNLCYSGPGPVKGRAPCWGVSPSAFTGACLLSAQHKQSKYSPGARMRHKMGSDMWWSRVHLYF